MTDDMTMAEHIAEVGTIAQRLGVLVKVIDESNIIVRFAPAREELNIEQGTPTLLCMNNAAAELLVTNPIQHERSKHFHMEFHFIREQLEAGETTVQHVGTRDQLADVFTKSLPLQNFDFLKQRLGMSSGMRVIVATSGSVRIQRRHAHACARAQEDILPLSYNSSPI